jgi:hypothetical protein
MKSPIPWHRDQFGAIFGACLHDGVLTGLGIDHETFSMHVRNASDHFVELVLQGVSAWNMVELCNGTIIGDIYLWTLKQLSEGWDMTHTQAWKTLFAGRYGMQGAEEKARRLVHKQPDSWLVYMDSSYGGELAVICRRIELFTSE